MKKKIVTTIAVLFGSAIFCLLYKNLFLDSGIPGVSIHFAYPFLAIMAVIFGPVPGTLIGFAGHAAALAGTGFLWNRIIGSALVGFLTGSLRKKIIGKDSCLMPNWAFSFLNCQLLVNALVWVIFFPVTGIILYKDTPDIVFLQGISAAIANMIPTVVLSSLGLLLYSLVHGGKNKKR